VGFRCEFAGERKSLIRHGLNPTSSTASRLLYGQTPFGGDLPLTAGSPDAKVGIAGLRALCPVALSRLGAEMPSNPAYLAFADRLVRLNKTDRHDWRVDRATG
jgi:hypothetical protein